MDKDSFSAFIEPWMGWEEVEETDIDFDSLEPVSTSNSLHVYSEEYDVDDYIYRLMYAIGYEGEPTIERKKKK